ncbi:hypothetical protein [Micromonospora aurantiaca (nom. illeg.)]|uniref:hypothetical protein n=1 Tax=Micromonospora aurantiaca (nom. illeg.) TaxID=47850 RepID=UPI0033D32EE1
MTSAPANLLAVRNLLLTYLNVDKDRVRVDDLEPAEVGIVGDPAHRGGYHCGSDRVVSNDYSVVESSRDRAGLSLYACALDVGTFAVVVGGRRYDLPHFSAWLASECAKGTPDTRDIREVIYSLDGQTVVRWDRLGRRRTGDSSHRWHTHISYHRDAIKAGRDQTPLFRRYLAAIGLIPEEDEMANFTAAHARVLDQLAAALPKMIEQIGYTDGRMEAVANGRPTVRSDLKGGSSPMWLVQFLSALPGIIKTESTSPAELAAAITNLGDPIDTAALAERILSVLTPQAIVAAMPPELARQVADELAARLAN